jgi:hypothetical protein
MKFRFAISLSAIALLALAVPSRSEDKATSVNAQRFEALKKLAGEWVQLGKDGKPTDKVISKIRVTSAGSAIEETLFPGSDHEMITMYHLDGPDLVLTHYCALGNQPRMKADAGSDVNRIEFTFVGATNLKSEDEQHMHQATLTLAGSDRFQAEWTSCKDGKGCHQVRFDLVRKQK